MLLLLFLLFLFLSSRHDHWVFIKYIFFKNDVSSRVKIGVINMDLFFIMNFGTLKTQLSLSFSSLLDLDIMLVMLKSWNVSLFLLSWSWRVSIDWLFRPWRVDLKRLFFRRLKRDHLSLPINRREQRNGGLLSKCLSQMILVLVSLWLFSLLHSIHLKLVVKKILGYILLWLSKSFWFLNILDVSSFQIKS